MSEKKKHPGGRPPKYSNPDIMQKKIDEYFNQCIPIYAKDESGKVLIGQNGKPIIENINAPTVTGLALFLGYADRQSIYDNQKRDGFSCILKKARSKVEEWVLQHTFNGDIPTAVGIFILKQFGYTDKQDLHHSGNMDLEITINHIKPDES